MIKILSIASLAAFISVYGASAQSIDYGMVNAYLPGPSFNTVQSPASTPIAVGSGGFALYVTNGSFTPTSSSTLSDITSNMRLVTSSTGTFGNDGNLAGQFYLGGLSPVTSAGTIAASTLLYALVSASSSFATGSPWALVTGGSDWLSPDPSSPTASTIIELSLSGNTITSAGFGGPGVGAYFSTSGTVTSTGDVGGNLILVPEPSTYALLAVSGIGMAGYVIRRRRRA
jgi:hypothetical protein